MLDAGAVFAMPTLLSRIARVHRQEGFQGILRRLGRRFWAKCFGTPAEYPYSEAPLPRPISTVGFGEVLHWLSHPGDTLERWFSASPGVLPVAPRGQPVLDDSGESGRVGTVDSVTPRTLFTVVSALRPENVIEVGCRNTASCLSLAQALADNGRGLLHCVEFLDENIELVTRHFRGAGLGDRVRFHPCASVGHAVTCHLPASELVSIDLDRSYGTAREALVAFTPLLLPAGIMVYHGSVRNMDTRRLLLQAVQDFGFDAFTLATDDGNGLTLLRRVEQNDHFAQPFSTFLGQDVSDDVSTGAEVVRRTEMSLEGRYAGRNVFAEKTLCYVLRLLSAQAVAVPEAVHVEIGTLFGGSAVVTLAALERARERTHRLVCIDLFDGFYGKPADPGTGLVPTPDLVRRNVMSQGYSTARLEIIKGSSHDEHTLKQLGDRPIASLFIDGDHSYEGVKRDWELYAPRVVAGGYVHLDNYADNYWPEVSRFVDRELAPGLPGWDVLGQFGRSFVLRRARPAS